MTRLLVVSLAIVVIGCSPAAQPTMGPPNDTARIGLTEWDIISSARAFADGMITLEITNAGATTHDVRVASGDLERASPMLAPGDTAVLTIETQAGGEVLLWCGVPGHRQQGMERRLPVAD